MNNTPHLRPLSIGDMFDAAFQLYRAHFWTLAAIAALVLVPSALLRSLFWAALFGRGLVSSFSPISFYSSSFLTGGIWSLTLGNLLHGALVSASARAYMGHPIAPIAAYRFGVRRYGVLVLASAVPLIIWNMAQLIPNALSTLPYYLFFGTLLTGPALGFQSWLRDLPGILFCLAMLLVVEIGLVAFAAYFMLVPQAVLLEDQGPAAAMRRSWSLVRGSARRALGIVIATGILSFMISTVPLTLSSLIFRISGANSFLFSLLVATISLAGQILLQPLLFVIFTLFYYDQRVRKEGYDLELLAQGAAQA